MSKKYCIFITALFIVALLTLLWVRRAAHPTATLPGKPGQPPITLTCDRVNPDLVMFIGRDLAFGFGATCADAVHDWSVTPLPPPVTLYSI